MQAGQLRTQVLLVAAADPLNQDASGEVQSAGTVTAQVWAKAAQHDVGKTLVTIRFRDDLTHFDSLEIGGSIYLIESIGDPDGRRERLEIVCTLVDCTKDVIGD